jgi:hypothetical protein
MTAVFQEHETVVTKEEKKFMQIYSNMGNRKKTVKARNT